MPKQTLWKQTPKLSSGGGTNVDMQRSWSTINAVANIDAISSDIEVPFLQVFPLRMKEVGLCALTETEDFYPQENRGIIREIRENIKEKKKQE